MTETRLCTYFPGGHAAYPQFASEENPDAAARMNNFYQSLRDAAQSTAGGYGSGYVYSAEYSSRQDEEDWLIEYTIRLRHRGKTVAAKTIVHRWRGGVLIKPRKKRCRLFSFGKSLDFLRRWEYNK
ncbi:MAG: hypothetical protein E7662_09895 [Ruminococcaceae bacterium]|nr:hypothetical protein [Oscillospiraceae bacterium]